MRWTSQGLELEADPRHAELVVQQLELQGSKSLSTPGVDGADEDDTEEDRPLSDADASKFRGVIARINYLAADRPDLQYATKEVCREMASPTSGSLRRLLRIGRYLVGQPRLIWKFALQSSIQLPGSQHPEVRFWQDPT